MMAIQNKGRSSNERKRSHPLMETHAAAAGVRRCNNQDKHPTETFNPPKTVSSHKDEEPPANKRNKKINLVIPQDADCICERGNGANDRGANLYFRQLVADQVDTYRNTPGRYAKTQIQQTIVEALQATGGRFLKKRRGVWCVLTDTEARAKVGQQLRYQIRRQEDEEKSDEKPPKKVGSPKKNKKRPPMDLNDTSSIQKKKKPSNKKRHTSNAIHQDLEEGQQQEEHDGEGCGVFSLPRHPWIDLDMTTSSSSTRSRSNSNGSRSSFSSSSTSPSLVSTTSRTTLEETNQEDMGTIDCFGGPLLVSSSSHQDAGSTQDFFPENEDEDEDDFLPRWMHWSSSDPNAQADPNLAAAL
uniref:DUF6824 domain-containing protein n=1 Tax=Entomoneis paludosa TaxID=265537 RepID=A0A7S3DR61_9STRA|mmetsp:Transcript_30293/g.63273  ORF Transcript_30293/g.63273 Transcript_30293/m.63273 type:complete len:356 (+) Transcript_30293:345-1412(+)|eukprot:CAMPEP_0172463024 /NCGR_PEP_ID=MMETSP1065-20121228/45744_1 /TAXON_ID=265537 /ORGANISM="Amphiprora paludosa, Strain CCMP125" /LENGTH=355 /DNA_ID=CAMNT_0013218851 /DNA_START=342 /DNA_END=1409 /DNA_ORIENTATION=+